jgi:hypothetical protein
MNHQLHLFQIDRDATPAEPPRAVGSFGGLAALMTQPGPAPTSAQVRRAQGGR